MGFQGVRAACALPAAAHLRLALLVALKPPGCKPCRQQKPCKQPTTLSKQHPVLAACLRTLCLIATLPSTDEVCKHLQRLQACHWRTSKLRASPNTDGHQTLTHDERHCNGDCCSRCQAYRLLRSPQAVHHLRHTRVCAHDCQAGRADVGLTQPHRVFAQLQQSSSSSDRLDLECCILCGNSASAKVAVDRCTHAATGSCGGAGQVCRLPPAGCCMRTGTMRNLLVCPVPPLSLQPPS